jgi:HSP20 family protein
MTDKTTEVTPRDRLARRESVRPFGLLDRFAGEMERMFDDFGLGRNWFAPARVRDMWAPQIEVSQRNNELVVHADLPGMKREDISVDVTDDAITISGERRQEHESERGGIYRSERSYGSFYRTIPLPEGAITDQAKATFNDGVLEIRMPAPPEQVTRGRRLEINEGSQQK